MPQVTEPMVRATAVARLFSATHCDCADESAPLSKMVALAEACQTGDGEVLVQENVVGAVEPYTQSVEPVHIKIAAGVVPETVLALLSATAFARAMPVNREWVA